MAPKGPSYVSSPWEALDRARQRDVCTGRVPKGLLSLRGILGGIPGKPAIKGLHSGSTYRGGGGFHTGVFSHKKISHRVYFAQWPENPAGNFAPFRIVLFASGSCTANFQRVPALLCEFPRASSWAFFILWGSCMTWISIPCPKHTFLLVVVQLQPCGHQRLLSIVEKVFTP